MPQPTRRVKSGNFEACIWENQKTVGSKVVDYTSISLRKSWKDSNNSFRDQTLNIRKQDIARLLVLLRKVQDHVLLEENK